MSIPDKVTLKVAEVSAILGIGLNQTYEAVKKGEIPSIKIGGRYVIPTAALVAMLDIRAEAAGV